VLNFFPKVAAAYYRPSGAYVAGVWVAATPSPTPLTIIQPQPADGRTLMMLPEGDRQYDHLVTWSETNLEPDDRVVFGGVTYRVVHRTNRAIDGGFYRAVMREEQAA